MELKKIDNWRWLLPKTAGMRTEGLIYASEKMLHHIQEDKTPTQVANVAYLPGIVGKSLAMPDIHWGYGFPIGGVAGLDYETGVISPGGIGYDINCISGETSILHEFGYTLKIKDFEKIWEKENIACFDFNKDTLPNTKIKKFLKLKPKNKVSKLKTETGNEIIATEDHPFWSTEGMKPLGKLKLGDEIAVYPFQGIPYEKPSEEIILTEKEIEKKLLSLNKTKKGNAQTQIVKSLKEKGVLPLRYNNEKLPYLLKIMGYIFGDGNIHFVNRNEKGVVSFYGEKENLEKVKEDISRLGWKCSKVYQRVRNKKIKTHYRKYSFQTIENWCAVRSSGLAVLLSTLGVPVGNKTAQGYTIPRWIFTAPLWQKRLFLASFFGAEMSSPKTITKHGYNFYCPTISMNKKEEYLESGRKLLEEIADLLKEFEINTKEISCRVEYLGEERKKTCRLRLLVSSQTTDLINLYRKIGFEYNPKRQFLANFAVSYLLEKEKIINERKKIEQYAVNLKSQGLGAKKIFTTLSPRDKEFVNLRFIERSIYENRKTLPRVAFSFEEFNEFVKRKASGLGTSGMVWERILEIEEIDFVQEVYDFTVEHHHHNFIANNFVVSNCGVRLLRTNLTKKDIEGKLSALVSSLFANIPSGVGSTGKIHLSRQEVMQVLNQGAKWAVSRGFGIPDDLLHTEEQGSFSAADATKVSQRALERGREQLGTLGAGNHFLEIQVVEEIYDPKVAQVFGLFKDQITILIHTGSRGLGYQVCDDYLRILGEATRKYGISLPDRQLACAPITSPEGQNYFSAMAAAANYAWANRQCITHWTRESLMKVLGKGPKELGLEVVYDVAHNIGKIEEHEFEGKKRKLVIHRKGATRAFPAGNPVVPEDYRSVGQPVLIPGTMGTNSYVLVGTEQAMKETWGSTCHGAGRTMSRTKALHGIGGRELAEQLKNQGIIVQAQEWKTLAEEAPGAYKDVNLVVEVCHQAGISKKVAKMRPLGVIKG